MVSNLVSKLNFVYKKYELLATYNLQSMNDFITYHAAPHHVSISVNMGGSFHRGDPKYSQDTMAVVIKGSITNNVETISDHVSLSIYDIMGNVKVNKQFKL